MSGWAVASGGTRGGEAGPGRACVGVHDLLQAEGDEAFVAVEADRAVVIDHHARQFGRDAGEVVAEEHGVVEPSDEAENGRRDIELAAACGIARGDFDGSGPRTRQGIWWE